MRTTTTVSSSESESPIIMNKDDDYDEKTASSDDDNVGIIIIGGGLAGLSGSCAVGNKKRAVRFIRILGRIWRSSENGYRRRGTS